MISKTFVVSLFLTLTYYCALIDINFITNDHMVVPSFARVLIVESIV